MIDSVPSMALGSPPETGASIIWIPAFSHSAAIALDSSGAQPVSLNWLRSFWVTP